MAKTNSRAKAVLEMGDGFKVTCESRGLKFVLDEPKELNGTNEGMTPVEALLNALAACKCIVAKSFAESKGVKLEGLTINCKGVLDSDGFMGKNPNAKIGLSEIETSYEFKTSSPKEKVEEFVRFIEAHCPVHDTIENTPEFLYNIAIK
ncbi:MAG: OsmC family protein [Treponemataceae bacterium]